MKFLYSNIKLSQLILLIFILQFMYSCNQQKIPDSPILAQVQDQFLTQNEIDLMRPNIEDIDINKFQEHYIQEWINNQVFLKYVDQNSITLTDKNKIRLEKYRIELLKQQVIQDLINTSIQISDAEIQDYYQKHIDDYKRLEDEYRFVILRLEKANIGIEDDIKHSESLMDVIEKNFLDNRFHGQLEKNGDQGYVPVSRIKKDILRIIKRNTTGKIVKYRSRSSGIYYIQVLDYKKANSYRELALVKSDIKMKLTFIKIDQIFNSLIEEQKKKLAIEINKNNLKLR